MGLGSLINPLKQKATGAPFQSYLGDEMHPQIGSYTLTTLLHVKATWTTNPSRVHMGGCQDYGPFSGSLLSHGT